ncbi:FG-GAP-like repeat-containing protein, partial [Elusimicrobiota bacterium]
GGTNRVLRNDGDGNFTSIWNSVESDLTTGVAWGDFDNDGDLDLAAGNADEGTWVYRNDGDVRFVSSWNSANTDGGQVAWGDYDKDGDLDLAAAGFNKTNRMYRNNGDTTFTSVWNSAETEGTRSIAWADYDDDGDLDLATANDTDGLRVYANVGGDSFESVWNGNPYSPSGDIQDVVWADFDGDGRLDLAAADNVTRTMVLNGSRPGSNTAPTAPTGLDASFDFHPKFSTVTFKWDSGNYDSNGVTETVHYAIAVATAPLTVSGDGLMIIAPSSNTAPGTTFTFTWTEGSPLLGKHLRPAYKVWPGDGTEKHGIMLSTRPDYGNLRMNTTYYFRVQAIDAGLRRGPWSAQESIHLYVPPWISVWNTTVGAENVSWGDFDNDGDLDLLSGSATGDDITRVYRSDGGGGFAQVWNSPYVDGSGPYGTAWGDFDNDGDLDLITGNYSGRNRVYRSNGDATFTPVTHDNEWDLTFAVAWGDYDNDGDLDFASGNYSGDNNRVFRNDGDNTFTKVWSDTHGENTFDIAWGDFDNDGDLDLLAGNQSMNRIYRNSGGDGKFHAMWVDTHNEDTRDIAVGDSDNDGDLDFVCAGFGDVTRLYRNDGALSFASAWDDGQGTINSEAVDLGDFDNDGNLDLLIGNWTGDTQQNRVYRNDGGNSFSLFWDEETGEYTAALAWADFNNDGDLDFAVAGNQGDQSRVYQGILDGSNSPPSAPTGLIASMDYDAQFSTMSFRWDGGDYDSNGSTESVHFAVAAATAPLVTSSDGLMIISPSSNTAPGSTFTYTWTHGSPLLGKHMRPAYKKWPGDAADKHGVVLSTQPNFGNLMLNTTYYFRVRAIDNGLRHGQWSSEYSTSTLAPPPESPQVYDVFRTSVTINWEELPATPRWDSAEGYLLHASSTNFGVETPGGTIYSSSTPDIGLSTLTVSGLTEATTYYFRVGSLNWHRVPNFVTAGSTRTRAASQPPTNPLIDEVFSTSITASWGGVSPDGGYVLDASTAPSFTGSADKSSSTTVTDLLTLTVEDLDPNTTYYCRVGAVWSGVPDYADTTPISTSTLALPPDAPHITAVFNSSMTVEWGTVASQGYRVLASSTDFNGAGTVYSSFTALGSLGSLTVLNLEANTTYYVRVGALNHNSVANYAVDGSSSTLADPIDSPQVYAVFKTSVTLNWEPLPTAPPQSGSAEGYRLDASTAPDFSGTVRSSVSVAGVEPSTLTVTGLSGGVTYYFRVGSLNWASEPNFVFAGSTYTLAPAPIAPQIDEVFLSSITASWTGVDPDDGYVLEASTAPSFTGSADKSSSTTVTDLLTLTVEGLGINTTYYLRAGAVWDGATSYALTTPISTATLVNPPLTVVAASTFSSVSVDATTATWQANSNPAGTRYEAVLSTRTPLILGLADSVTMTTEPAGVPSAAFGGLQPDTTYYLFVRALNHNSVASDFVALGSTSTLALPPDAPHITAVFNSSMTVEWGTVASQGYRVLASSTDFNGAGTVYSSFTALGSLGSLSVLSLEANTTYYVRVGALNHNSVANYAVDGSSSTLADPIDSPQVYAVFKTSVTLNWEPLPTAPPQGGSAEGYRLDASTAPDFTGTLRSSVSVAGVEPSTLTVTGLSGGATYYFRVGSLNWASEPNFVFAGSTFTFAPAPIAPQIDEVFLSSITASWGGVDPYDGYVLEASTAADFSGSADKSSSTTVTDLLTLAVEGLAVNTTYYLRAGAVWGGATSYALTTPASTSTLATLVTGTQVHEVFMTSATINWVELPSSPMWDSAEGYLLQASTASNFSGTMYSSSTPNVGLSTLTVTGLGDGSTFYFRVGSLNWNGVPNFAASVSTQIFGWFLTWTGGAGFSYESALGDYDNDGDLDMLAAIWGSNRVYRNDGTGSFTSVWNTPPGPDDCTSVAWGDFDNDGDLDMLSSHHNGGKHYVFANNGDETFDEAWNSSESESSFGIRWGDYDNDGDLDFAVASSDPVSNRVYRNNGNGSFVSAWNSATTDRTFKVEWGDIDNDGDLDLAEANQDATDRIYRNDGVDIFVQVWNSAATESTTAIVWGDYDNDGDLDLATGIPSQTNRVYRNNGSSSFVSVWNSVETDNTEGVAWGDYDNDGDLDLVAAAYSGTDRVYRNNGDGTLSPVWRTLVVTPTYIPAWGDVNGDGMLDLVIADETNTARVYQGRLSATNSAPSAPAGLDSSFEYSAGRSTFTFKWDPGDYDANGVTETVHYAIAAATAPLVVSGDGLMIIAPSSNTAPGTTFTFTWTEGSPLLGKHQRPAYKLWPGDTSEKHGLVLSTGPNMGNLLMNTTYHFRVQAIDAGLSRGPWSAEYSTASLAALVTGTQVHEIFMTSATINWVEMPSSPRWDSAEGYLLQASTASNFSGTILSSSTPDIGLSTLTVTGLGGGSTYYFRVGSLNWNSVPNFAASASTQIYGWHSVWNSIATESSRGLAAGDFDNDGDLDLAVGNTGDSNRVYVNNGDDTYTSIWNSADTDRTRRLSWGDFDNDGDLDLAAANESDEADRLYRNNGDNSFTSVWTSVETEWTQALLWGDYDNDGDLDLAAPTYPARPDRIYRNDGNGGFTPAWNSGNFDSRAGAWGDFDNDGDLDVILGAYVYRNDGGAFDQVGPLPGYSAGNSMALGDYDNDGDLDLALGGYVRTDRVYVNDGQGGFTSVWNSAESDKTTDLAWGDFDADGDLDLVVCNDVGNSNRVYRNDGAADFTLVWRAPDSAMTWGIQWADMNGDGRLDIATAETSGPVSVYTAFLPTTDSPPSAPTGLDAGFEYGAALSTITFKWDSGDYDSNGVTETVHYAIAAATAPLVVSGDGLMIISPSSNTAPGATFTFTWTEGSPLLGKHQRPAYKLWPGDASEKHGLMLSAGPNMGNLLMNTTYYFRVQAIDAGLARGPWSAQSSTITLADRVDSIQVFATFQTSATVNWRPLPAAPSWASAEGYLLQASTASDFSGTVHSSRTYSGVEPSTLTVSGLSKSSTYYFRVGSLNWVKAPNFAYDGYAFTGADAPDSPQIDAVFRSSITVSWGGVSPDNGYVLEASTASDFSGTRRSSSTPDGQLLSLTVESLDRNTTHYLRVGALWGRTTFYAFTAPPSTATLADLPVVTVPAFSGIGAFVMTGGWGPDANPAGTLYDTVLSTRTPLILGLGDSVTVSTRPEGSPAADFTPLSPNTTYYLFARAFNHNNIATDFVALDSTSTLAIPPADPHVAEVFKTSTTIAWAAVASRGYRVLASSTDFNGAGTTYSSATADGTLTSLSVIGLEPNTTYYYQAGSINHDSVANYAIAGSSSTLAEPVSSIQIHDVFTSSVTLNWVPLPTGPPQTVTGEGYRLDASTAPDFTGTIFSSQTFTGVEPSTLTVMDLGGNTTYYFRVGSLNWDATPNFDFAGSTLTRTAPPDDPQISAVFHSSITVSWGGVLPDEGYVLEASTASDFSGDLYSSSTPNPGLLTLVVEGLSLNTTYFLQAGAVWGGTTEYARTTPISTATLVNEPLSAISTFSAITAASLTGSWDANSNPAGTRYEALLSTRTPLILGLADSVTVSTSPEGAPSADFGGLQPNTTYYLFARALNHNSVASDFTALGSTSTLALPPGDPHIADMFKSSAAVSWTAVSATGYRVIASSTDFNGSGLVYSSFTADGTLTSLYVTGLEANTTYYLRVGSLNHDWVANYAVDGSSSSLTEPVSSEQIYGAFVTSITVNWAPLPAPPPQSGTAEGYRLDASTAPDFSGTLYSSVTAAGVEPSTLSITGLTTGTTYYLRVGSLNWESRPNYVLAGSTFTLATAPVDPRIDDVFPSSITVSWGGVDPDGGYVLDASTASDFSGDILSSSTPNPAFLSLTVRSLDINTTYFLRAGAVWGDTTNYAPTTPVSTSTLVNEPLSVVSTFSAITDASLTGNWGANSNPLGTRYEAWLSTETPLTLTHSGNVLVSTAPEGAPSADFSPLDADTTYYLFVRALNHNNVATEFIALGSTSTLTLPPGFPHITEIFKSSVSVAWTAVTSEGYRVIASSTDFDGSGAVLSSVTTDGTLSSLYVTGLDANTTYYLRVGSLNHNWVAVYASDGSSSTLTEQVSSERIYEASVTSITVNWVPLAAPPPQSGSAEGYRLDASTASDFSGTLHSSITLAGVEPSTLTITGLNAGATYYLRIGPLNWESRPNYRVVGSTMTRSPRPISPQIDEVAYSSVTVSWGGVNPDGGYVVEASTASDFSGTLRSSETQVTS